MSKLVILASGAGSNALNIINHFKNTDVKVCLIATNKKTAGVLNIAEQNNIPQFIITKDNFEVEFLTNLEIINPDLVILAGFLWKIPQTITKIYKIVNIHPALLPKFGGAGMWGHHVHEAVFNSKEKESGITIHWVNENYDQGEIIKQYAVSIDPQDTPKDIESKVRKLEAQYFPPTIQKILKNK